MDFFYRRVVEYSMPQTNVWDRVILDEPVVLQIPKNLMRSWLIHEQAVYTENKPEENFWWAVSGPQPDHGRTMTAPDAGLCCIERWQALDAQWVKGLLGLMKWPWAIQTKNPQWIVAYLPLGQIGHGPPFWQIFLFFNIGKNRKNIAWPSPLCEH